MMEKIELYKEVLELEPNSKLFFPLARLLTEADRFEEAAQVLERGLERHDDFLEARLFLIELLHKMGKSDTCEQQIEKLVSMLSAYAGFWQAWAAYLTKKGGAKDAAAVMHFLAACFVCGPISLHELIEKGALSLLQTAATQKTELHAQPLSGASSRDAADVQPASQEAILSPSVMDFSEKTDPSFLNPHAVLPVEENRQAASEDDLPIAGLDEHFDPDMAMADDAPLPEVAEPHAEDLAVGPLTLVPPQIEDCEERFSLRTRSMAEVLAEQGDIQGALEIYQELATMASGKEEVADLQQRMATLNAQLNSQESSMDEMPLQAEPVSGKDKLIHILGALAERVEARAHS